MALNLPLEMLEQMQEQARIAAMQIIRELELLPTANELTLTPEDKSFLSALKIGHE